MTILHLNRRWLFEIESRTRTGGGPPPLPLWERVGVRGSGLSIVRNPSPGSHLAMRHSQSFASASLAKNGRRRRPMLSHKGRGDTEHLSHVIARRQRQSVAFSIRFLPKMRVRSAEVGRRRILADLDDAAADGAGAGEMFEQRFTVVAANGTRQLGEILVE